MARLQPRQTRLCTMCLTTMIPQIMLCWGLDKKMSCNSNLNINPCYPVVTFGWSILSVDSFFCIRVLYFSILAMLSESSVFCDIECLLYVESIF